MKSGLVVQVVSFLEYNSENDKCFNETKEAIKNNS